MPEETSARALRLDLSGLREEHVHREPPWSGRTAVVVLVALTSFLVAGAVVAVLLGQVGVLVRGLVMAALLGVVTTGIERRWPSRTVLRPEELDVRDRGAFRDRCGWGFVAEVRCRPARRVPGVAVLQDGRRLRLVGLPADHVARLEDALARARAAGPAAAA